MPGDSFTEHGKADDAAQLIQVTLANFNTQPDKIAISRINESLLSLQQARELRIRESESSLKSTWPHCVPQRVAFLLTVLPRAVSQSGDAVAPTQ